jgi:hypothetical protein
VYTNAAYSRLSGIDSHLAVGKPLSTLLSTPDQEILSAISANQGEAPSLVIPSVAVTRVAEGNLRQRNNRQDIENENGKDATPSDIAAEAVGRARAAALEEAETEMCLERLVAVSGHGKCHAINVLARPHHMLGRNVTVTKSYIEAKNRTREEGGNGSSITSSNDGPYHHLTCNMIVSPVVSSPEAFGVAVVTDKDQESHQHKTKRRKHHHSDSQQSPTIGNLPHRRIYVTKEASMHRKSHLITHYVIQLELFDETLQKFGGIDSQSSQSSISTSAEARMLGLTKPELKRLRLELSQGTSPSENVNGAPGNGESDERESETMESKEQSAAIG